VGNGAGVRQTAASLAAEPDAAEVVATLPSNYGTLDSLLDQVQPSRMLICLPVAMTDLMRQLAGVAETRGVAWSLLPSMADHLAGRVRPPIGGSSAVVPRFDPLELIGRQMRGLDEQAIAATLTGRVVLITGAGGSIGSELARIVARFKPARLVLVERAENALFEIDRNLRGLYPDIERSAVLHDVTNGPRSHGVVTAHKPHVIFHAAAHKHVPLMEDHASDAVENNFYGTRSIADAAARNGVDRFVMISTDKAVNPSSVMGASKRVAELYIQHLNMRSDTTFSMVRFGNVLGSACSVLPIWSQQLSLGQPITVTDPRMTRYFMTIPEAAGLVIQSAAFAGQTEAAGSAEVFLLDMGEPIRIVDLAERFIRSHGLEPNVDVPIQFTGIRPGEKLFEELAYTGEDMLPTPHPSIRLWRTTPPTPRRIAAIIRSFDELRDPGPGESHPWRHATRDQVMAALRVAVPEMVAAPID